PVRRPCLVGVARAAWCLDARAQSGHYHGRVSNLVLPNGDEVWVPSAEPPTITMRPAEAAAGRAAEPEVLLMLLAAARGRRAAADVGHAYAASTPTTPGTRAHPPPPRTCNPPRHNWAGRTVTSRAARG